MKEKLKFEQLEISEDIKKAVKDMGFENMTDIQSEAIPYILTGVDVIGQAQTGTGKTAAIGIPMIEKIDINQNKLQGLVLCPTRELAIQFAEEMKKLSKYKKGLKVMPIYGGQSMELQIRGLKRGAQIVVGTPGRIMDHMRRKTLNTHEVKILALDEADEMLNMGFIDDIETILKEIPSERQTALFSATMPKAILDITKKYLKDPKLVKIAGKQLTVSKINQKYFEIKEKDKLDLLTKLLRVHNPKLSVVFCNTKKTVDELVSKLQARGFFADAIHGDLSQNQRDKVMNKFRSGIVQILIATDVMARGIDVDDVEAVFNYDLPQFEEYYVHRIGRTGRAGREGRAFSFVCKRDLKKLKSIEKYTKNKIQNEKVPSDKEVEKINSERFLNQVKETISGKIENKYYDYINDLAEQGFKDKTTAAGLLKMFMNYKNKKVEEAKVSENKDVNTGAEEGMIRLFVNLGKNHKVNTKDFIINVAEHSGIRGKEIGKIDIYDKYSFIEVPEKFGKKVIKSMNGTKINGSKVRMEPSNPR